MNFTKPIIKSFTVKKICIIRYFSSHSLLFVLIVLLTNNYDVLGQRVNTWSDFIEDDNFKEGIYSMPVGGKSVELISFYKYLLPIDSDTLTDLILEADSPASDSFLLTIQEKRIVNFYLLQSKPANLDVGINKLTPWKDINYKEGEYRSSNNLGVILESYSGEGKHILPLSIANMETDSLPIIYNAIFRLNKSIKGGNYRIYQGKHPGIPPDEMLLFEKKIGRHMSGAIFRIQIDEDYISENEGWCTVKVNLEKRNSKKGIPYSFYFYHSK